MKKLVLIPATVTFVTTSSVVVNGQSVKQKAEVNQRRKQRSKLEIKRNLKKQTKTSKAFAYGNSR
jgi:hypothetical protein